MFVYRCTEDARCSKAELFLELSCLAWYIPRTRLEPELCFWSGFYCVEQFYIVYLV